MLNSAATQIAQQLSDMLVCQGFARFQFDDQFAVNQQIGKIITQNRSIFVQHLQSVLLFNLSARLTKPIGQPVLINLFQMPVSKIAVQGECSFTNLVTQLEYFLLSFHISVFVLCFLCLFAAMCFIS